MMQSLKDIEGMSIRSEDGYGRIAYRPDFSKVKPFAIYFKGTAVNSSHSLEGAIYNLLQKGCTFSKPYEWK